MGAIKILPTQKNVIDAYKTYIERYFAWTRSMPKNAIYEDGVELWELKEILRDRSRAWGGYTKARDQYHTIAQAYCLSMKTTTKWTERVALLKALLSASNV